MRKLQVLPVVPQLSELLWAATWWVVSFANSVRFVLKATFVIEFAISLLRNICIMNGLVGEPSAANVYLNCGFKKKP